MALGNLYAAVVPLNVQGAYDNAKSAFGKASVLNPTAPTIPFILAQLEISNKDAKAAQEALLKSISLKQDYTPAIFLLSQLEVASGNLREALAAAEAAAYFTPNDPTVLFQVGVLRAAMNNTDGAGTALLAAVTANPDFANARYFLAAIYAKKGAYQEALSQVEAIAALSEANASAVASLIADLKASKNPFPANLLSSPPPVSQ
jgi:tetratricopeptide (TPR) repeat protein